MGHIPGRFNPNRKSSVHKHFVTKYIQENNLQSKIANFSLLDCEMLELCEMNLRRIVSFMKSIELVYSFKESTGEFIAERPDFYLGRFLNSFADMIYSNSVLGCELYSYSHMQCETNQFEDVAKKLTSALIVDYFTPEFSLDRYYFIFHNSCIGSTQKLLNGQYSTFVDVVKYSEIKNFLNTDESRTEFQEKYVKSLTAINMSTPERPVYLTDRVEIIYFCDFKTKRGAIYNASENKCSLFQPFLTPKGFCFTFNSLSMKEIFRPTDNLRSWDSVLNFKNKSTLLKPTGSGPSNGVTFVLNSFERFGSKPSRKSFIISITNEINPFDIVDRNYFIVPGYSYTFRVLANQMMTSEDLKKMEPNYRKCLFANESVQLNLTQLYSKSSCEYECLLRNAVRQCKCIPWYIPELPLDNLTYCHYQNTDCITSVKTTFRAGINFIKHFMPVAFTTLQA